LPRRTYSNVYDYSKKGLIFSAETSKITKSQILSQAATSMLAQAYDSKQNLLALLQG
tara:strand:+ start:1195 stop:1365 length:171 start_codon:yes stop_codon:yes gene_type:complete